MRSMHPLRIALQAVFLHDGDSALGRDASGCREIALALVGRVAGMIEEFRTNHRDVRQPCRSSDAHRRQLSDFREPVR